MNLEEKLISQPWKFSLHQFMFLSKQIDPNLKFKGNIDLSPSPSDIIEINQDERHVLVNGISLLGIQGALPIHYIDMIMNRKRKKDHALQDFLDIFNNKIINNTFDIKKKSVFSLSASKFQKTSSGRIANAIGLGELHNSNSITRELCTALPILFWSQKSPNNLIYILQSFLKDAKVECKQFIGKWIKIEEEDQTILRSNCKKPSLGLKFLGKRFWNSKHGIKIIITTKSLELYSKLLPNESFRKDLELIIKSYIPYNINFQIELNLIYKSQPTLLLGKQSILSYFSWLNNASCEKR
ncbi:type VI secretion system baseplate subunit TssG [Candidatus Cytomitobacter indipagum]|uniref:Type VI secretion system baseplate subunit TssG n=1 Tax=Candidatus Cytomitobacter indipagum TaxID=2601575 RepID=A0A5C0UEE2_9PROT|nr:type VI secretion system baseplate subunit TssG [Candidatus Cytomitobacter indipagum]QEK38077.1 type VI secretion system baseplate subunit TssG [Candidatus Cytomitobacter indipagum]